MPQLPPPTALLPFLLLLPLLLPLSGCDDDDPTEPGDTTPPAAVTDLELQLSTTTPAVRSLTWTAPGDDGDTGRAAQYDLRASADTITAATFELATPLLGVPAPGEPGITELYELPAGYQNGTWSFALRAIDEAGNVSATSNVVVAAEILPAANTLIGQLVRAEDDTPIGPMDVSLLDLDTLAAVGLVEADAEGNFRFDDLPPGDYLPVIHSPDRVLFGLPRTRFSFVEGDTLRVTYPLSPVPPLRGEDDLILEGQVIDRDTGLPIPFARIEMSSFDQGPNWSQSGSSWSEFRGGATTQEPVADEEGRFTLGPIPTITFIDPGTGETRELIASWRVTAPGYRAVGFDTSQSGNFDTDVTVRMPPGRDVGVITGTVVDVDGAPLAGVPVYAEWRRDQGQFPKGAATPGVIEPDAGGDGNDVGRIIPAEPTDVTDALGRFRIEALPAGGYNLLAGAAPDDGWVGIPKQGIELTNVEPERDAGELIAAEAIDGLSPANLEEVFGTSTLTWPEVDGAVSYQVVVRRASDLSSATINVPTPRVSIVAGNEPFNLATLFRWEVFAIDVDGNEIAATDRPHLFRYDPQDRPPAK